MKVAQFQMHEHSFNDHLRDLQSSLVYISIAYHMKKRGGGQIACKNAYVITVRSPSGFLRYY